MLLCALPLSAQMTSEQYKASYDRQVRIVGATGVGVETILDRWAEAYPDDTDMLEGRFHYYFEKSRSTKAMIKPGDRYLGKKPVLTLPDSTGGSVNFFEEPFFVDSLFALSATAIDRAVAAKPDELSYRFKKIAALLEYEKESPDMAGAELLDLIELNRAQSPGWTYGGEKVDKDFFISAVQEYCYSFFNTATPSSYEMFRAVSERMCSYYPEETVFVSNLGTYWLIARKDDKKALKYYNKVLKAKPDDYSALKNCVLLARSSKNVKLEKKYLPALINACQSDTEKMSAQA